MKWTHKHFPHTSKYFPTKRERERIQFFQVLKIFKEWREKSAFSELAMDNKNRATTLSSSSLNSSAFSFISKGWREIRDSADTDIQLMRHRANSFKNLATSFDRELENFFNSATTSFSLPEIRSPLAEIDFVKRLQLKLSEFWRAYSSPDFSKKVLEKWTLRSRLQIDLSAIRNAIVAEVEDGDGVVDFDRVRKRNVVSFREF